MKTDNPALVGVHAFEKAGLGQAPFQFLGMHEQWYTPCPGAPSKPGGCCAYCGNGILYVFTVKSADGKTFGVGCDCINKIGDAGLIKAYKNSPEFRKAQSDKRAIKAQKDKDAFAVILAEKRDAMAALPHPNGFKNRQTGEPMTLLDFAEWMFQNCGASGRGQVLRRLQKILA